MSGEKIDNFVLGENDIAEKDMAQINFLLKQLSPTAEKVDLNRIKEVMHHGVIVSVRDLNGDGEVVGIGTLLVINKLFSLCGTIEDVVVEEKHRGKGLGRKITQALILKSELIGMKFVDLTSHPKREAANKLYQSVGFEKRETNVYRYYLQNDKK